jgi:hypothetical protein
LNSPGNAIDTETRGFFEPRFGHDFGQVRVHADAAAANSARDVNALAYTVGNDLVFDSGQYAPQSGTGRNLLAHELAHTVQQSSVSGGPPTRENLSISPPGDAAEQEAAAIAHDVIRPSQTSTREASPHRVSNLTRGICLQRQVKDKSADPGKKKLEQGTKEAVEKAGQKIQNDGGYQLPPRVPAVPQPRHVPDKPKPPATTPHAPAENLRPDPDPFAPEPKPVPVPEPVPVKPELPKVKKPDPGTAENQLAVGGAYQSGPNQAGVAAQAAFQDKNYVAGVAYDFCKIFHVQFGVLQPTYTIQLVHLSPLKSGDASAANPSPPPDTAQFSATFSPIVLKVGDAQNLTLAPQVGIAGAVAGDAFGTTKGPGQSGGHTQALGVVNLQVDYKLSDAVSLTGTVGYQRGIDSGPKGNTEVENVTGSVMATFHFQ